MTESQLPDDVQELVNRLFGYAREGGEEASQALDAYLQNGLDPNLSNQDGNSLVMLAADPTWGTPNAIDTARMFGREDLVARFES